jgi:outer membrane lipopolysaccharide assembly protein LptE/RlpB
MIKKKIIIIFLALLLTNCGFVPIYSKNSNINLSIEQITYAGDTELNNFLKTNLIQYKNEKVENKFYIEVESSYEKIILTKDGTGEATNYELKAEVIFIIKSNNRKIKFTEKKIINSMSDKFEEARYERSIKQSFASSISYKLITELVVN